MAGPQKPRGALVGAYAFLLVLPVSVQAVVIRPVALEGQPAAGTQGVRFDQLLHYAINSTGQVFFSAVLDDNPFDHGLWLAERTGLHSLLARVGNTFPHSLAVEPGAIPDDSGNALFKSDVNGRGEYGRGLWLGGSSGLHSLALAGDQAPGTGLVFWDFLQDFLHNLAGQSAFRASIVDPANRDLSYQNLQFGIFEHNQQSGLSLVARRGMAAPGLEEGIQLDVFQPLALTNSGNLLFWAGLLGDSITSDNYGSIWIQRPNGPLTLLVRDSDPVAGLPSDLDYRITSLDVNNDAHIGFATRLEGKGITDLNRDAVISFSPGKELSLVARTGDQAPGTSPGVHFFGEYFIINFPPPGYIAAFRDVSILNSGQVIFEGHLAGPGVGTSNDRGIWIGNEQELELLVRTGEPVPGMPSGTVFAGFEPLVHNQLDEIILGAWISGPGISDSNNNAIWRVTPDRSLEMLLREGDSVAVAPGDVRTIAGISMRPTRGNDDGDPSIFNDAGEFVVHAWFTDGSTGLLVLDTRAIPEPTTATMAIVSFLASSILVSHRRSPYSSK